VTKQGDLHTKIRKIQDDLEEPHWDKNVDDVIWEEDDDLSWKIKSDKKPNSTTNDLTKMKDWTKLCDTAQNDEQEKEKSKIDKKKKPKSRLFGLDENHSEWHFTSNLVRTSSYAYAVLYSVLILCAAHFYTKTSVTKTSNIMTISPITALTKSHPSVALIPKYQDPHKELIIKSNYNQMANLPLFSRDTRYLNHPGIISDCSTEIYSTDSYLFIASCTFGILIFRSPVI
jgi:hypothetical protein